MDSIKTGPSNLLAQRMLEQIPLDHTYKYEILRPEHIKRVVEMFTVNFCDHEPMTRYVDMPYEGFSRFANAVTSKAAVDGLSVVAMDGDMVIACALVEDVANPLPMDFEVEPKFGPIFSLLEYIGNDLLKDRTFKPNQIAHLFITAVDKTYQRQGLSRQVNFRAMALAVDRGYTFMLSELTNYYNERGILPHLRYNKLRVGSQIYKDFIFENAKPFANLEGGANSWLWELRKNPSLEYEQDGVKTTTNILNLLKK